MDPQFGKKFDDRFATFEQKLDARFDKLTSDFEKSLKMHVKRFEALLKTTADGHAMQLDRIQRKIDDLGTSIATRLDDHERILADHNDRITAIERRT